MSIREAKWIKSKKDLGEVCPLFFAESSFGAGIKSATLEITALGVYEASINGVRVGDFILAPGWASYARRQPYQTYDVTTLVREGGNLIEVAVGKGWRFHKCKEWGTDSIKPDGTALIASLTVEYEDGSSEEFITDKSWKVRASHTVYSSIYNGEIDDFYRTSGEAYAVTEFPYDNSRLDCSVGVPVTENEEIGSPAVITTPKGETVLDFGQEITGYVRFRFTGFPGRKLALQYFEMLDRKGNVYTKNLRTARQRNEVIQDGNERVYAPRFTFFGFRYVRLEDWPEEVKPENFTAVAVYSKMERTSEFECSDELINKFYSNVLRSQRGNFLDVPTDCPQRNERLGWTGDAQVFSRAAALNYDVSDFFKKWLADLRLEQREDGSVPATCPVSRFGTGYGSPGWADVAVILPWNMYLAYGDRSFLEDNWDMMTRWVDYMQDCALNKSKDGQMSHPWTTDGYGDWLSLDNPDLEAAVGKTDKGYIATAYFALCASILVKAGRVLGKDAAAYRGMHEDILRYFRSTQIDGDGKIRENTQTACVLAIAFDLTDDKKAAGDQLARLIHEAGDHLTTGFIGSAYLLHALTDTGHADVAYTLMLRREFPSWLYAVTKGATTVWERWNGIRPDGKFAKATMNSFNHYAYGAVEDWLVCDMAGLNLVESDPGYASVIFAPKTDPRITHAKASLVTARGKIISEWTTGGDGATEYVFTVPEGVRAYYTLPGGSVQELHAGENRIKQ
ncbi:MAG: family 78 glycoside hydrolase catalytic domain [Clostridia bacterium]|nr:family 78 glycoside hydrolase catalytic domain [Clostridia bacterium]